MRRMKINYAGAVGGKRVSAGWANSRSASPQKKCRSRLRPALRPYGLTKESLFDQHHLLHGDESARLCNSITIYGLGDDAVEIDARSKLIGVELPAVIARFQKFIVYQGLNLLPQDVKHLYGNRRRLDKIE